MESKAAFEKKLKEKGVLDEFKRRVTYLVQNEDLNDANAYSKSRKEFNDLYFPKNPSGVRTLALPAWCNLEKQSFTGNELVTSRQAVDWAVENAAFKDIKSKDAPSATAWLYLERFRADPGFLNDILKKRVQKISENENNKIFGDDGRKHFQLIDKLLSELSEDDKDSVLLFSQKTD